MQLNEHAAHNNALADILRRSIKALIQDQARIDIDFQSSEAIDFDLVYIMRIPKGYLDAQTVMDGVSHVDTFRHMPQSASVTWPHAGNLTVTLTAVTPLWYTMPTNWNAMQKQQRFERQKQAIYRKCFPVSEASDEEVLWRLKPASNSIDFEALAMYRCPFRGKNRTLSKHLVGPTADAARNPAHEQGKKQMSPATILDDGVDIYEARLLYIEAIDRHDV